MLAFAIRQNKGIDFNSVLLHQTATATKTLYNNTTIFIFCGIIIIILIIIIIIIIIISGVPQ